MARQVPQSSETILDKLFRWKKTVEFNGVVFYIRIVSDAVIEDARRFSLLESRKLRKKLRDPNSDETLMFLDSYNDYTDDEIIGAISVIAARTFMREYLQNTPRPIIAPPQDGASQEELEQYEEAKEEREKEYARDMKTAVEAWREALITGLRQRSHDDLLALVFRYETDNRCELLYTQVFEDYVVAASVYKDAQYKERMFTYDEYKTLPSEVKRLIYDAYNNLNIGTEDIKNS